MGKGKRNQAQDDTAVVVDLCPPWCFERAGGSGVRHWRHERPRTVAPMTGGLVTITAVASNGNASHVRVATEGLRSGRFVADDARSIAAAFVAAANDIDWWDEQICDPSPWEASADDIASGSR